MSIVGAIDDLNQSLLGLEILLLCTMTIDCCATLNRSYKYAPMTIWVRIPPGYKEVGKSWQCFCKFSHDMH
jgi:hypothetical protein